jgi:hypothetical protein
VPVSLGKIENAVLADAQQLPGTTNPTTITTSKRESILVVMMNLTLETRGLGMNLTLETRGLECSLVLERKKKYRSAPHRLRMLKNLL